MEKTIFTSTNLDTAHYTLPLLPLKNVVILPKSIIPIMVGRPISIQAVEYALKNNLSLFITAQKDAKTESPTAADVYHWGTRSAILQVMRMPNGSLKILAEGICRSRILASENIGDFLGVQCEDYQLTDTTSNLELEALWRQLKALYETYTSLNEKAPLDLITMAKSIQDMDSLSDTIAAQIKSLTLEDRQKFLETVDLLERMLMLCGLLKKEIEILETEQRIRGRIQTQVEKSQREYYLTEQMKAIQKELGREDQSAEIAQLRSKAKTFGLPKEAHEKDRKRTKTA